MCFRAECRDVLHVAVFLPQCARRFPAPEANGRYNVRKHGPDVELGCASRARRGGEDCTTAETRSRGAGKHHIFPSMYPKHPKTYGDHVAHVSRRVSICAAGCAQSVSGLRETLYSAVFRAPRSAGLSACRARAARSCCSTPLCRMARGPTHRRTRARSCAGNRLRDPFEVTKNREIRESLGLGFVPKVATTL